MSIKKIVAVGLAIVLAMVLAACGSSGSAAPDEGTFSGSSAAKKEGSGEKTKITVWNAGLSDTDDTGEIAKEDIPFNRFNAMFEEENNVELEITRYNMDQMSQLMTAATMSNELPDVIILWAGSATNDFSDVLLNLEDYMTEEEISQYSALEICRKGMTSEGKLQALPLGLTTYGAYYNKDVFSQAGITEMPKTWDEFITVAKTLKDSGFTPVVLDQTGYSDTWVLSEFLADEMGPAGITSLKDGAVKLGDDMPVELMEQWQRLYKEGLVNDGSATADSATIDEMFVNGQAGIRFNGSWSHKDLIASMGDNIGVFQIPAISTNAPFKGSLVSQPGLNIVVTNQSENPELAVKYIQHITCGEFQTAQCLLTGDIPSISTADMSQVDNPLTVESYKWLKEGGEAVIGFDSIISAEAANDFYRNVVLFFTGQLSAKELGDMIDAVNLKD